MNVALTNRPELSAWNWSAASKKGSVKAALAITKNEAAGVIAARQVLDAVTRLTTPLGRTRKGARPETATATGTYDARVVSRISNIDKVREIGKTKVEMGLLSVGGKRDKAVIDERTTESLSKLHEANFAVDDVTVYGKLFQLRDRQDEGGESTKTFFGELKGDDAFVWRVEFKPSDAPTVNALFRQQIYVTAKLSTTALSTPRS